MLRNKNINIQQHVRERNYNESHFPGENRQMKIWPLKQRAKRAYTCMICTSVNILCSIKQNIHTTFKYLSKKKKSVLLYKADGKQNYQFGFTVYSILFSTLPYMQPHTHTRKIHKPVEKQPQSSFFGITQRYTTWTEIKALYIKYYKIQATNILADC